MEYIQKSNKKRRMQELVEYVQLRILSRGSMQQTKRELEEKKVT